MKTYEWPYPVRYEDTLYDSADVLVLGGGLAGCCAALAARRAGKDVILADKGGIIHSGSAGAGVDHWMSCPRNPASRITVDDYMSIKGDYDNIITSYLNAMESWEVLEDLEALGLKIRDIEGVFKGAAFRDEKSGLLFAYDYRARYNLRFWGTGLKPVLYRACCEAGVRFYERVMVTGLLTQDGQPGNPFSGAVGMDTRTGCLHVFSGKTGVLAMSTPERLWIFSSEWVGLIGRDGPPVNAGNGHAMAWRSGAAFAKMEHSSHEEWGGSTGIGSVMFGSGTAFASYYPCNLADADGNPIPWIDQQGRELSCFEERVLPKEGFFSFTTGRGEGGVSSFPTPKMAGSYKLPLYADFPSMDPLERRVIFGLMIGQEGQTWPVYRNLTRAGFDPDQDMLQVCALSDAPIGWRRLRQGGLWHGYDLQTTIPGLFGAGQQLYDGCGCSTACTTGRFAGQMAAFAASNIKVPIPISADQIRAERERIYAPVSRHDGISWKELEAGIAKVLQDYCGDSKNEELMRIGLLALDEIQRGEMQTLYARHPHELMRCIEVMDILTCGQIILQASLARQASSDKLEFSRIDYPACDPEDWRCWVIVQRGTEGVRSYRRPFHNKQEVADAYVHYRKLRGM